MESAVLNALKELGGQGRIVDVAKQIWRVHEADLRSSGDLFYTWQYDMRWAAQNLRKKKLAALGDTKSGSTWKLTKN